MRGTKSKRPLDRTKNGTSPHRPMSALALSCQPATSIAVMISGEIVVKDGHFTARDKRSIRENRPRRLNSQVRQASH